MSKIIEASDKAKKRVDMKQRWIALFGIALCFSLSQTLVWAGNTIYVWGDAGPGPQDGSVTHPYDDLVWVVEDLAQAGDEIVVFPGNYLLNDGKLEIRKNLVIRNLDPNVIPYTEMTHLFGTVVFSGPITEQCVLNGFSFVGLGLEDGEQKALQGNHTSPSILNCIFMGNGPCAAVIKTCDGLFQNCLIADNSQFHDCGSPPPVISDCNATFLNCTIVNNRNGIDLSGGFIENCIITGNGPKGSSQIVSLAGREIFVQYSDVRNWMTLQTEGVIIAGEGMMDQDPNFVQPGIWDPNDPTVLIAGDYHLKSKGWRWSKYGQEWTQDDWTSPCIDAGNPETWLANEMYSEDRADNSYYDVNEIVGGWNPSINLGVYGGTYEASFLQTDETPATSNNQSSEGPSVLSPDPVTWEIWPQEYQEYNYLTWQLTYGFTMTAGEVNSSAGNTVLYMFDCSNDLYDSGWSASRTYQRPLSKQGDALKLRFRVKAKDSVTGKETGWSNNGNYTQVVKGDF